mmetsp:Transcript_20243/g.32689  ORF Transcript_20243/g.32689 Transcript_20243/m.32689 type:complete len:87 (+) Transcript_20243:109-369(+)
MLQTSAAKGLYAQREYTSGATNGYVPTTPWQAKGGWITAVSKSVMEIRISSVVSDIMMLSGLMSRWAIPGPVCMWEMPELICARID